MTELILALSALALLVASYFFLKPKKDLPGKPPTYPNDPPTDPYCCKNDFIRSDGVDCGALDTKFKCENTGQACCKWTGLRCICECNRCK